MSAFKNEFYSQDVGPLGEAEQVIAQLDALDDEKDVLALRDAVTAARNKEQGSEEKLKDLINNIREEKGL